MRIRRVERADITPISRLYYETVHRVNSRDYSPEQIDAWAPRVYPDAFWQRRFRRYFVLVAEEEGAIVGFAELAPTGEIDCFYVHHAHQHRGVGAALMARIEREAHARGSSRLTADVSITAEPFFRRMGFRIVRRQIKIFRNRAFKQAVMEKRLSRSIIALKKKPSRRRNARRIHLRCDLSPIRWPDP
jgi:putative acetyltransferase